MLKQIKKKKMWVKTSFTIRYIIFVLWFQFSLRESFNNYDFSTEWSEYSSIANLIVLFRQFFHWKWNSTCIIKCFFSFIFGIVIQSIYCWQPILFFERNFVIHSFKLNKVFISVIGWLHKKKIATTKRTE